MPKILSEKAITQFKQDGYYFPVPVLSAAELANCRTKLETYESSQGKPLGGAQRSKSHLLFRWVDDLMRNDTILDAVEDLIGPDLPIIVTSHRVRGTVFWQTSGFLEFLHSLGYSFCVRTRLLECRMDRYRMVRVLFGTVSDYTKRMSQNRRGFSKDS